MVAIVSGNSLGLSLGSMATLGQRGVWGEATQGRSGERAYVNAATGNLVLQTRDEYVAGSGQDLVSVRTYNSQGLLDDDNGDNWALGVYRRQVELNGTLNTAGSTLTRTSSDGARAVYQWDAIGERYASTAGAGAYDFIVHDSAVGEYQWTDGDSATKERYDALNGRLKSSIDVLGSTLTYVWSAEGRLTQVTDGTGASTSFEYAGDQLTRVIANVPGVGTASRVHYDYDGSYRLSRVTVDGPTGSYVTNYTYDGISRRVSSVAQSDGTSLHIVYAEVDGAYRVASIRDALNHTTSYSYNTAQRLTTVVDAEGLVSTFQYDAKGQLIEMRQGVTSARPKGLNQLSFVYNTRGDVLRVNDGFGCSVAYEYDANGNQTRQIDAAGNTMVRAYDARNRLVAETAYERAADAGLQADASEPQTTRYVYDTGNKGLLRFTVSAEGRVIEHRYNLLGQRTATIEYSAGAYDASGLGLTEAPTEAAVASWAAVQDSARTLRTERTYDMWGQLSATTVFGQIGGAGAGSQPAVTTYVHNSRGELLQVLDANGRATTYTYDGLGRRLTVVAPAGDGNGSITTTTSYGDAAHTVTITSAEGLQTISTFDAAGRLVSVAQASGAGILGTTVYAYDDAGRLVQRTDPSGVHNWMVYDGAGRKVADIDGTGTLTEYVYNRNDQITQVIVYDTELSLALLAAPTALSLPELKLSIPASGQRSWNVYDSAHRLVWQIDALGYATHTAYDGASRVIAINRLAAPIDTSLLEDGSNLLAVGDAMVEAGTGTDVVLAPPPAPSPAPTPPAPAPAPSPTPPAPPPMANSFVSLQLADPSIVEGQALRMTVVVAGNNPTGTVRIYDGETLLTTVTLANGRATISLDGLDAGTHLFGAVYDGDSANAVSNGGGISAKVLDAAAVAVAGAGTNSVFGGPATLTATVTGSTPTGTVSFFEGQTLLGSATLVDGLATFVTSSLSLGAHNISAIYSGNADNASAASVAFVHTVAPPGAGPAPTSTTIAASASYIAQGQSVTLTAFVNSGAPGMPVSFYSGNTLLGTANLLNGQASLVVSSLPLGTSSIKAMYGGSPQSAPSASGTVAVSVSSTLASTSTLLTASENRLLAGQILRLSARVAGAAGLSGFVAFYNGTTLLGVAELHDGLAAFEASGLVHGMASISAIYGGQGSNASSISQTVVVDVGGNLISSAVTLASAATQIAQGQALTLTIGVSGAANASGLVGIYNGTQLVATGTVANGQATVTVSGLLQGAVSLKAVYFGGQTLAGSMSGVVNVSVGPAVVTVVPTTTTLSVLPAQAVQGQSVALTADVTGGVSANGMVKFYNGSVYLGEASVANITKLAYDANGNVLERIVDPTGLALRTVYSYDARGSVLSVQDANGVLTEYVYDALGRRTRESIDPGGLNLTRTYEYDDAGNLTRAVDASRRATRYAYDANGRLVYTLDAEGGLQYRAYDSEGRLVQTIAYATAINTAGLGNAPSIADLQTRVAASPGTDRSERRVYDNDGRLTATVSGRGEVVKYSYDANGNVTLRQAYAKLVPNWQPGQTLNADPADRKQTTVYDALNRAIYSMDGTGAVVQQVYDANGNLTQRIGYAAAIDTSTAATPAAMNAAVLAVADGSKDSLLRQAYDAANRVVWKVDGTGAVTGYQYDKAGNLTAERQYLTKVNIAQANPGAVENANDRMTEWVYDAANRRSYELQATQSGQYAWQGWVYDDNGNLLQQTQGAKTVAANVPRGLDALRNAIANTAASSQDRSEGCVRRSRVPTTAGAMC